MTTKERKIRWLANEFGIYNPGMRIDPLPRRPTFLGNKRPSCGRLVLDPMTGKPATGPVAALMALCMAETLPCNG